MKLTYLLDFRSILNTSMCQAFFAFCLSPFPGGETALVPTSLIFEGRCQLCIMLKPWIEPGTFRSSVWSSPNWAILARPPVICHSAIAAYLTVQGTFTRQSVQGDVSFTSKKQRTSGFELGTSRSAVEFCTTELYPHIKDSWSSSMSLTDVVLSAWILLSLH